MNYFGGIKMRKESIVISGTGSYVPYNVVSNKELEKTANTNCEWVENVLGIKERRILPEKYTTSDMALEASLKALEMADMIPEEIDIIIAGTITPDRIVPSLATIVQRKINAINAVAYDINAACAGFVFSLITAEQFLKSGYFNNALIIGADALSRIVDYRHRDCVFYGDGAGAVVLKKSSEKDGIISTYFCSDGQSKDIVTTYGGAAEYPISYKVLEDGKHFLKMYGKGVGQIASNIIPKAIEIALSKANMKPEELTWLIPHQPNITLLKNCAQKANISEEKVIITLDKYANTSSGNIPIALDKICREGKLKDGDRICIVAIGAGWTWGSAIIEWAI